MYLKSIEIRGFKSFADRTEMLFKDGITAVVGPNGSGKSNISDAVRWVLGEQSIKQLRGGKMEDVIFAGTQYRKPLGQASVSLTLDNQDKTLQVPYSEVTVTRRLYRSGESEYLLNNNTVRLKDIHELFMDTGIGKEGYSMIGQGKIEAILSGKPEERRSLVEEAAGIVKFKARKEEGEKKLKNAQENLDRVEDIITTYEERIEPLKLEKEKAEKFVVFDKELKELTSSLLVLDLKELEERNIRIIEDKKRLDDEFSKLSSEKASTEEKNQEIDDILSEITKARIDKREEYYNLKSDLDNIKMNMTLKENNLESLENNKNRNITLLEESNKSVNKDKEKLKESKTLFQKYLEESSIVSKEVDDLRNTLKEKEEFLEESQKSTQNFKDKQEEIRSTLRTLEHEIQDERRKRDFFEGKKESLSGNSSGYLTSLKLNEDSREKVLLELKSIEKEVESLSKTVKDGTFKIKENREKLDKLFTDGEKLRREIISIENKIGILKNLEDNHEGYNKSVKDLMNRLQRENSPYLNTTSIVGEVITTKKKYSTAIEAALGAYIQNIITDTDEQAKNLIAYLKKHSLGRCTFLPLNIIKATKIPLPQLKNSKVFGFASDLVEYDEKFKNVVENILGRTLVASDMNEATKVARETNFRIKIVTLEGDIISSGGAMTGGSQKVKSSILSRKNDLESLETSLIEMKAKLKNDEEQYRSKKSELDDEASRLYKLDDSLKEKTIEKTRLYERFNSFDNEIKRLNTHINKENEDISSLENSINESLKKIEDNDNKRKDLLLEIEQLEEKLISLRNERNNGFSQIDEIRDKITEKRLVLSEKENEKRHASLEIERLNEEIKQQEEEITRIKEEIEKSKETTIEIKSFIESSKLEIEKTQERLLCLDKEIEETETLEVKKKSEFKTISNALNTLREEYYALEKEILKVNISLEKYEDDRGEILRKLNEEMNLTLAEAKENSVEIENRGKAKRRCQELKGNINSLGLVNLGAIAEYENVTTHWSYLTKQRDDLLKAKEELLNLISEMTSKMKNLFRENFALLQKNFSETFRQLFNGGTGELSLSDGDELSSNIEITVQPPGKKLQNINLMSGGEKVLSAIALTFAILRMKPSPFCILDEIEAALDDANVYRYATFLKEFAGNTQFILITHRKGTMEAANVLYGVTMEEKGISKIVNVDLEKVKEA